MSMAAWKFVDIAKAAVVNHVNVHGGEKIIDMDDVDIVWMHQTETTNRAILSVIPPNDMLYEVTYKDPKSMQLHIYPKTDTVNVTL